MKYQILTCMSLFLRVAFVWGALEQPPIQPIVGGQEALKDEYPWQILLKYKDSFTCGGSILNERTILTAAFCVDNDLSQSSGNFTVIAGEWDQSVDEGTEQTRNVAEIRVHKKYNPECLLDDIAILILESALQYTSSVQPVVLLSTRSFDKQALHSTSCVVTGWGIHEMDPLMAYEYPDKMHELVSTNVVTNRYCNEVLPKSDSVSRTKICTVDNNAGFCYGDSGGPMGCFDDTGVFHQVGIVDWKPYVDCYHGVQVYIRLSVYLDWIEENKA